MDQKQSSTPSNHSANRKFASDYKFWKNHGEEYLVATGNAINVICLIIGIIGIVITIALLTLNGINEENIILTCIVLFGSIFTILIGSFIKRFAYVIVNISFNLKEINEKNK